MNKDSEKVDISISNPSNCSPSINDSVRLQAYTEVEEDLLTDELKSIFADLRSVILGTNPGEIQIQTQSTRSVEKMGSYEEQHIEAIARGTDASLRNDARYGECRKNHAANIGGYAVDGCGEFMASGEEGTAAALNCAACHCHRNFHIQEVENETLCECHRTRRLMYSICQSCGRDIARGRKNKTKSKWKSNIMCYNLVRPERGRGIYFLTLLLQRLKRS